MSKISKMYESIKTKQDAKDFAITWQEWQSKKSFNLFTLSLWNICFTDLGKKFGLTKEFKENGII